MMKEFTLMICLFSLSLAGQRASLHGQVREAAGEGIPFATLKLSGTAEGTVADADGWYTFPALAAGTYKAEVSAIGFSTRRISITLAAAEQQTLNFTLEQTAENLSQVVVTGTMKAVSRANSPVPVEVYSAQFFRANPAPSVFESLQNINGVRPQLNCAVCNTGDIHINGLEGPYTMVLIDGMPIVSGLSTVYGLTGIPQQMIARTEVVKGPASTLYGSEAVGGLINVITRSPEDAPSLSIDVMASGWGEVNTDLGFKASVGESAQALLGINYFNYRNPVDNNADGFTDLTLQDRISIFNKWSFARKSGKILSLAARYVYEDRFGGQLGWDRGDRGGNEVYGESIYTNRWETMGTYQLPTREDLTFQFSTNGHYQNSAYGETIYDATQYVGFGQLTWNKTIASTHDLLLGFAYRYTWYDDNTPVTAGFGAGENQNQPSKIHLPGVFIQNQVKLSESNTLLLGLRYDYNSLHGNILTPRLNYKWNSAQHLDVIRLSLGSGYRVANVFTEDHAALTGAREVVFTEDLLPETSWNTNLNYTRKWFWGNTVFEMDATTWYTHFSNRILPDYETNPNAIIYRNLAGNAVSRGGSLNTDLSFSGGTTLNLGATFQEVFTNENGAKEQQLLTESTSAVWRFSLPLLRQQWRMDYTGNVYGPMKLPLLGPLDERPAESPWFSIQNLQLTKTLGNGMEFYGGVKNLLNYTPPANSIARAFDPFDRGVTFAADGSVLATETNPQALTFDPTYVYASNQGRRWFLGWRWAL